RLETKGKVIERLKEEKEDLKRKLELKKNQDRNIISKSNSKINDLKKELTNLEEKLRESNNKVKQNFNYLSNENIKSQEKTQYHLESKLASFYAGKPTPNREFTQTTLEIIEHETVFKLSYIDESRTNV